MIKVADTDDNLVILPGEVTGKYVGEALDVGQLLLVHQTPPEHDSILGWQPSFRERHPINPLHPQPGDDGLEGDNVVEVLARQEGQAPQLLPDGVERLGHSDGVHHGLGRGVIVGGGLLVRAEQSIKGRKLLVLS